MSYLVNENRCGENVHLLQFLLTIDRKHMGAMRWTNLFDSRWLLTVSKSIRKTKFMFDRSLDRSVNRSLDRSLDRSIARSLYHSIARSIASGILFNEIVNDIER